MEYIHKAKAEKSRTKVLSDQMEARRIKNKVRPYLFFMTQTNFLYINKCRIRIAGCSGASCCAYRREERGNSCSRARGCEGIRYISVSCLLPLRITLRPPPCCIHATMNLLQVTAMLTCISVYESLVDDEGSLALFRSTS
jgi:hypothetical protein